MLRRFIPSTLIPSLSKIRKYRELKKKITFKYIFVPKKIDNLILKKKINLNWGMSFISPRLEIFSLGLEIYSPGLLEDILI